MDESDFGGFTAVDLPEEVLDFWGRRRWRLLEEVARWAPDVVALEECDHFGDFFEPALAKLGYAGAFVPKAASPSCHYGFYSDGVALFWKSNRLAHWSAGIAPGGAGTADGPTTGTATETAGASEETPAVCTGAPAGGGPVGPRFHGDAGFAVLGQKPSPHAVLALRHLSSGRPLVVAATHLKSKVGAVGVTMHGRTLEPHPPVFMSSIICIFIWPTQSLPMPLHFWGPLESAGGRDL